MQHTGAGWGTTPAFSRGNVLPPAGNGAGSAILRSSRWDSRAGSQILALPAFQQEWLLGRCSKAEVGRRKVPSKPACHPSTSTIALVLQTNSSNWQILKENRAAGLCSKVSRPGSAAGMNPMHQQRSDPKVKPAIRAPAERAGQALPSASSNSTDVKKPWADLCQLRANPS